MTRAKLLTQDAVVSKQVTYATWWKVLTAVWEDW